MSSGEVRYWTRVNQNFMDANRAVPGVLAPPLFGMLTGRALANVTTLPTLVDAAVGSYRAGYLTLEIAPAAAHFAINFILVGATYEAGLYMGSMINAAPVPWSGGVTYREWYSDQMCSASGGC